MQLQKINMKGEIKSVPSHLAFDKSLQISTDFFPCDDKGNPIETPEEYKAAQAEKKSVAPVADSGEIKEPVIIPPGEGGESESEKTNAKILSLAAEGKTNAEIGKEVGYHWKTVEKVINDSKK